MAYIGKEPTIGNFQKCDAISVVNGQAAYTLQVGGTNVVPESVNHMLVSLNGILQAPTDSFTVSGSTLTFASNLATGDVIDFVMILGNVLDLGVPSDNTVTAAKLNNDIISGQTALATAPDDTDEFLVSDAGTIKRIDYSLIKGGGMYELIQTQTISSNVSSVDFTSTQMTTSHQDYLIIFSGVRFDADTVKFQFRISTDGGSSYDSSSNYRYANIGRDDNSTTNTFQSNADDDITLHVRDTGNATGESISGIIEMFDPLNQTSDNKFFTMNFRTTHFDSNNFLVQGSGAGAFDAAGTEDSVINGVRLLPTSNNISAGVFSIYGRKTS
tara:strand:+ start:159 stop:1142 length:984 start_codon:yes stop_codon:yes gene_type:complete